MPEPIIIDISSLDPKNEKNQLSYTQKEAYGHLEDFLFDTLENNEKAEDKQYDSNCCLAKEDNFQRTHNTIFINGKRGSGKTQFLLSVESYINDNSNKEFKSNSCKFYFFKPIDPTLLHDNENFLTIIVAMILNHLENNCQLHNLSKDVQKEFYTLLSDVSKAIDGTINCQCVEGNSLETIAQDQSSLKLERYMNKFFKLVLNIVKKEKLVILIDDIDMALNKGFEVLEVIRKYLSSSYIIPIVTGDIELYTPLVQNHFLNSFSSLEKNIYPKKEKLQENLLTTSDDYLIKVFPMHRRIHLKTFWDLAEERPISFKFYSKNQKINTLTFFRNEKEDDIDKRLKKDLKLFSEKIKKNLFKLSTRSIIQIFKREMHEDFDNFLKSIKSLEKIKKEYNYEILSTKDMLNSYEALGKEELSKFNFQKAITLFLKIIELDNKRYTALIELGNSYYELATQQEFPQGEKEYINSIKYYKKAYQQSRLNREGLAKLGQRTLILSKLADSYLELLELYLITEEKNKYRNLAIEFKELFRRERDLLKVEEMFEILQYVAMITRKTASLEKMLRKWHLRYDRHSYTWNFEDLYDWGKRKNKNEEKKILLLRYIEYFEENL